MTTTLDLLEAATVSLTRPTSIKDRLADAYRNYLAFVDQNDLPESVGEQFRSLTRALTREPPMIRGEDALSATVRKMSSGEAAEAACTVVRMFSAVWQARLDFAREAAAKDVTNVRPLYAAKA